ncbi:MAG: hypothetical protein AAGE96_22030 [Cyanobacteria bacterium P01_G01_bin.19]
MENDLSKNKKVSIIKRIYRKIILHWLIDAIMPILSSMAVSLKPTVLFLLKPILAILTLVMGFVGFISQSIASEISDIASSEIAEESGSNILEIVLDFLL